MNCIVTEDLSSRPPVPDVRLSVGGLPYCSAASSSFTRYERNNKTLNKSELKHEDTCIFVYFRNVWFLHNELLLRQVVTDFRVPQSLAVSIER